MQTAPITAVGPSNPVPIKRHMAGACPWLPPSVCVSVTSADGTEPNITWAIEVCAGPPDFPATDPMWKTCDWYQVRPEQGETGDLYALKGLVGAVRVNVYNYVSGELRFAVMQ